jgi:hypothetical protein
MPLAGGQVVQVISGLSANPGYYGNYYPVPTIFYGRKDKKTHRCWDIDLFCGNLLKGYTSWLVALKMGSSVIDKSNYCGNSCS